MRYKSNPTRINVDTNYGPTSEIEFPAVTFCNPNFITNSQVSGLISSLWVDLNTNLKTQLIRFYCSVKLIPKLKMSRGKILRLASNTPRGLPTRLALLTPPSCRTFRKYCQRIDSMCKQRWRSSCTLAQNFSGDVAGKALSLTVRKFSGLLKLIKDIAAPLTFSNQLVHQSRVMFKRFAKLNTSDQKWAFQSSLIHSLNTTRWRQWTAKESKFLLTNTICIQAREQLSECFRISRKLTLKFVLREQIVQTPSGLCRYQIVDASSTMNTLWSKFFRQNESA